MTAVTARVAGVQTVFVASPRPADITIAAAYVAGADALMAIGGAQAIAALAYGVGGVPECDVIVGPGNRWVTAAKSIVSGKCGIDMLAGPSECLVLADESADAALIAADLIAQAEHDTDALPVLVTTHEPLVAAVEAELAIQLAKLPSPNKETATVAVGKGFAVVTSTLEQALAVTDTLGPEHLEVQMKDSDLVWKRVKNYGGMFVGSNTAEVFGDYGAGPNHVLPTSGTARYTGGLSVFTFLRIRTWLKSEESVTDKAGLNTVIEDSAALARCVPDPHHRRIVTPPSTHTKHSSISRCRLEGLFGHEAAALARKKAVV